MMPEKKRAPHQSGRGKGNVSQIQGHLCDKTADELLTELEARMDEMTDLTYDEDVIDSYLAALDKKAPLEKDFDVERSWEKFRSQHAILFDEDILPKPEVPQRGSHGFRFRRAFARVVVVAAIVAVFTMFCAQAAGIDVFGAIGRWTEETFRFAAPAGPATSAVSAVPVDIDGVLIYEVEQYPTLQDAFDAHSISEPLAPSWIPEGYVLDYVEASPSTGQVVFTASYSSGQSILNLIQVINPSDCITIASDKKSFRINAEMEAKVHYEIIWMNTTPPVPSLYEDLYFNISGSATYRTA